MATGPRNDDARVKRQTEEDEIPPEPEGGGVNLEATSNRVTRPVAPVQRAESIPVRTLERQPPIAPRPPPTAGPLKRYATEVLTGQRLSAPPPGPLSRFATKRRRGTKKQRLWPHAMPLLGQMVTHLDANMEDFDEAFGPNSPIGKLKRKLTQGRAEPSDMEDAFGHEGHFWIANTGAALCAAAIISPAIAVIDMGISRAQFQKLPLGQSLRGVIADLALLRTPWNPLLRMTAVVYTATYLTANYTKFFFDEIGFDYKLPVSITTSVVNIGAIAYRDRTMRVLANPLAGKYPLGAYGCYAVRDGLTIVSSFVLKNLARDKLQDDYGLRHRHADLVASFAVPITAQLVAGPFHIIGQDLSARPEAGFLSRLAEIPRGYAAVCGGRALRIIPAFGVGGYLNDVIRETITGVEEHER